jgi:hypothetical protein
MLRKAEFEIALTPLCPSRLFCFTKEKSPLSIPVQTINIIGCNEADALDELNFTLFLSEQRSSRIILTKRSKNAFFVIIDDKMHLLHDFMTIFSCKCRFRHIRLISLYKCNKSRSSSSSGSFRSHCVSVSVVASPQVSFHSDQSTHFSNFLHSILHVLHAAHSISSKNT